MAKSGPTESDLAKDLGATERMAKARAAKGKGPRVAVDLDDRQRFALRTMQAARSSIKTAQDGLKAGWEVPADLIDACAKINGAVGKMLFE